MYRQMKPARADAPVKSKKPLQPTHPAVVAARKNPFNGATPPKSTNQITHDGKVIERRGDPELRARAKAARLEKGLGIEELGEKIGVSAASVSNWENGRYVPHNDARLKWVRALDLPDGLGEAASLKMEAEQGRPHA
jgi:DNA-binding XRE family transcriptional regulator